MRSATYVAEHTVCGLMKTTRRPHQLNTRNRACSSTARTNFGLCLSAFCAGRGGAGGEGPEGRPPSSQSKNSSANVRKGSGVLSFFGCFERDRFAGGPPPVCAKCVPMCAKLCQGVGRTKSVPCQGILAVRESTIRPKATSSNCAARTSEQGPLCSTLRANPLPEVTVLFCRLPLESAQKPAAPRRAQNVAGGTQTGAQRPSECPGPLGGHPDGLLL